MYVISKASSWALRAGLMRMTLLSLLGLTLLFSALHSQAQAHAFLRQDQRSSTQRDLRGINGGQTNIKDNLPTITKISVSFFTHNDNKDHDTSVSVFVQNKVGLFATQDLAKLENFAGNDEFGDNPPSTHTFDLQLASDNITFDPMRSLPIFTITIAPNGHDRWIFDATITITTSDGMQYSGRANGIVLDQDNRVYNGVFGR